MCPAAKHIYSYPQRHHGDSIDIEFLVAFLLTRGIFSHLLGNLTNSNKVLARLYLSKVKHT